MKKERRRNEEKRNNLFDHMTLILTYLALCSLLFGLVTILYLGLKTIKLI